MTFTGWQPSAIEFYRGLEADNSKAYWSENKAVYESEILAPMNALLSDLADEFGEAKIFRPYRDVRFSADKSPYKTWIGAVLRRGGYVELSAAGLGVGSGCYTMAPDQLRRYRDAVDSDIAGPALASALDEIAARGIGLRVHDSLKRVPRGFAADHPRAELLQYKDLAAWTRWEPDAWLSTPAAADRVVGFLRDSAPLVEWLDAHVGASELPERTRP
jgi:uncharacterized protein (TIGR02453 family)